MFMPFAHQARKPIALDLAGKVWAFLQTRFPLLKHKTHVSNTSTHFGKK